MSRTSVGTPPIHVPAVIVTATPSATTPAASIGRGRRAAKPSRRCGASPCGSRSPPCRSRAISAAETKNDAAFTAKNTLTGMNASSAAASAQPPIESDCAVACTSAFACCTFSRSTSVGTVAPYAGAK